MCLLKNAKKFITQGVGKGNIFRCFFNNSFFIRKQCMIFYKHDTINIKHYLAKSGFIHHIGSHLI